MNMVSALQADLAGIFARMNALGGIDEAERAAVAREASQVSRLPAHRAWSGATAAESGPCFVLSGWGARVRNFVDGRRQILEIYLPGEVIASSGGDAAAAGSSVVALANLALFPAPAADGPGLAGVYRRSAALRTESMLRQIARLGRMSAQERLIDWFLEVRERIMLCGTKAETCCAVPLTQEVIADVLGLTSVHVNRSLKALRGKGLHLASQRLTISDPARLAEMVEYTPLSIRSAVEPLSIAV